MTDRSPEPGTLLAYLDGELPAAESEALEARLRAEPALAAELDHLRASAASVRSALASLDVPARQRARRPWTDPDATTARAAVRRRPIRPWARAAMVALALGAGAASALPGSPVRAWLATAWERVTQRAPAGVPPDGAPTDAVADDAVRAGVSVPANLGRVVVSLPPLAARTEVVVRLEEAGAVWVRAGPQARYVTAPGRIEVQSPGELIEVTLPAGLSEATIQAGDRILLHKSLSELDLRGPVSDSAAAEIRFRVDPDRDPRTPPGSSG
jgi:anti-sigma factor RsiW